MIRTRGTHEAGSGQGEKSLWMGHDTSEYQQWNNKASSAAAKNPKLSEMTLSVRLPDTLLESIKAEANKRDMPYQLLIKVWLAESIEQSRNE